MITSWHPDLVLTTLSDGQRKMLGHDRYTAMRAETDEELAAAFETVTGRAWEVVDDGVR